MGQAAQGTGGKEINGGGEGALLGKRQPRWHGSIQVQGVHVGGGNALRSAACLAVVPSLLASPHAAVLAGCRLRRLQVCRRCDTSSRNLLCPPALRGAPGRGLCRDAPTGVTIRSCLIRPRLIRRQCG